MRRADKRERAPAEFGANGAKAEARERLSALRNAVRGRKVLKRQNAHPPPFCSKIS